MNVGTGYVVFWYRVSQDGYVTNYMIAFMDVYISFRCTYVGAMMNLGHAVIYLHVVIIWDSINVMLIIESSFIDIG